MLVAQSCLTLYDPMACSPPGSSVYGDSPGKNTRVGCHSLLQGIFTTQGWTSGLPHAGRFFTIWATRILNNTKRMSGASQVALVVKNLPVSAEEVRDVGLIPGLGRSPGRGQGNPLQYSCLETPMARGAWRATVHRVTNSHTWLSILVHTVSY